MGAFAGNALVSYQDPPRFKRAGVSAGAGARGTPERSESKQIFSFSYSYLQNSRAFSFFLCLRLCLLQIHYLGNSAAASGAVESFIYLKTIGLWAFLRVKLLLIAMTYFLYWEELVEQEWWSNARLASF